MSYMLKTVYLKGICQKEEIIIILQPVLWALRIRENTIDGYSPEGKFFKNVYNSTDWLVANW